MLQRNYMDYLSGHLVAITGVTALHAGVAMWAMQPTLPIAIQQQTLQISMVAPSSPAQAEPEAVIQPEPAPVTPPRPDGMTFRKKAEKKPAPQPAEKVVKPASQPAPTSGMQAPDATEKVAARTEPVFDAAYLRNPAPAYPAPARRGGVQGKVMLEVDVNLEGSARSVSVASSSGSSLLDNAALDAVKRWRFVPAHRGSEVVEAHVLVPVEFKLN